MESLETTTSKSGGGSVHRNQTPFKQQNKYKFKSNII